jgi:4-hydroxybenzoate polyprenyltransferase/phosphoglycolate phosphatase-like HAD superfamily hydrolase
MSSPASSPEVAAPEMTGTLDLPAGVALCVDLDGTLVKSDTLLDTVLAIARQRPAAILHIPGWIGQGKAAFKRHLTATVDLDVEHLPYNRPLMEYLRVEHGRGRAIYLATAADRTLAERVAAHVGIFAGVLASDGATNLAGGNKLAAFRAQFGDAFCYIGNAKPDAELLAACVSPMVANPDAALRSRMKSAGTVPAAKFEDRTPILRSWLKAVRLHQWAKNVLIFVPLLLAHQWAAGSLAGAATAFLSFGMCASATYIINDLLDLEADRKHPRKRRRPFAAGDLSAIAGVMMVVALFVGSATLALVLPRIVEAFNSQQQHQFYPYLFAEWLALYTVTTLSYSLYFKRKLLLDVFLLSGLYTIRILAGSAATMVAVSPWLGGFSVFFFLSLAFVKRFSELESLRERGGIATAGRGYAVGDLEQLRAFGVGSAFAAVLVTTLYISSPDAMLYARPKILWLVVPVLLLWLCQVWMLASRGEMHDDPVVFAITDKRSLLLGVLMAMVIGWAL